MSCSAGVFEEEELDAVTGYVLLLAFGAAVEEARNGMLEAARGRRAARVAKMERMLLVRWRARRCCWK